MSFPGGGQGTAATGVGLGDIGDQRVQYLVSGSALAFQVALVSVPGLLELFDLGLVFQVDDGDVGLLDQAPVQPRTIQPTMHQPGPSPRPAASRFPGGREKRKYVASGVRIKKRMTKKVAQRTLNGSHEENTLANTSSSTRP